MQLAKARESQERYYTLYIDAGNYHAFAKKEEKPGWSAGELRASGTYYTYIIVSPLSLSLEQSRVYLSH